MHCKGYKLTDFGHRPYHQGLVAKYSCGTRGETGFPFYSPYHKSLADGTVSQFVKEQLGLSAFLKGRKCHDRVANPIPCCWL